MSPLFDCSAFARVTTNPDFRLAGQLPGNSHRFVLASVTTNPDFRLAGQLAPIFCELNLARTGNPIRKKNHSARKNLEFDMFGTNAMVGLLKTELVLPLHTTEITTAESQK